MSDHKITLVPIATGYFQSPELFVRDKIVDTGLFAESLIYYDSVYVHVDNPVQFAGFISLLIQQGFSYAKLIEFIEDGVLRFFNSVIISPFMGYGRNDMVSSLWAIQESAMDEPNYFSKRFLEFEGLKDSFSSLTYFNKQTFDKFCQAAEKTAITFNNQDISTGLVDNAYEDFLDPKRHTIIVKNLLKELFKANKIGKAPKVKVKIQEVGNNYHDVAKNRGSYVIGRPLDNNEYKIYEVEYNKELIRSLIQLEDTKTPLLKALSTLPLSSSGQANLIVRSANKINCDLFLASPISKTIGDKLYEIDDLENHSNKSKIGAIIEKLEAKVEFPNLRHYVNEGKIDFEKVLEIRKKAKQFRDWLQMEKDRDRDAIIAYHNEVARQTGFTKVGKTALSLFGVLASTVLSVAAESYYTEQPNIIKESFKNIGGKIIENMTDKVSQKLFNEWKPVCFGNWYKEEIEDLLKSTD